MKKTAAFLMITFLFCSVLNAQNKTEKLPYIIFILADDLGYGDIGPYGQQKIKTPHLDQLAKEGMHFTDFYAGSTVCAPSRASLMPGQHTGRTYIRGNGELPLRQQDSVLPQYLKQNGYVNGMVGKWGLGQQAAHVLGSQANLWTEFITTQSHVLYMMLPRMLALSEVVWSPKEAKDWKGFNERLQTHFTWFDQRRLPYSKGNFRVEIKPASQEGQLFVSLSTEAYKGEVYYTTNGSQPTTQSKKYTSPLRIDSSLVLKAVTVVNGKVMSAVPAQQSFVMHKAVGRSVSYANPVGRYYMADGANSLTDGVKGTLTINKYWHGFSGRDLLATIDLGEQKTVWSISLGCLQHYNDWIMLPQWVKFEVLDNGQDFREVATVNNTVSQNEKEPLMKEFVASFGAQQVRFVRVRAKVLEASPKGHSGEG